MNHIKDEISKLKKEKNAVILAHYYVVDEVQEIADFVGDSYYLSKVASQSEHDIIVFCGVEFMGESAKILNPTKKVLLPDMEADCPMAHMATKEKIREMRSEYEDLAVVCYINSTAELKCESDVCVTSSNAVRIVRALPNKNIFFIPDGNLGREVKKAVPEKNIILNSGFCKIHQAITKDAVEALKAEYRGAKVLAHPECGEETLSLADYIGSTSDIITRVGEEDGEEFIICTETGVLYELNKKYPNKKFFFPTPAPVCENMKKITLEKILYVLSTEENEVTMDNAVRVQALRPLQAMLELAK